MIYSGVEFLRFSFGFLNDIDFMNIFGVFIMIEKYSNELIAMHFLKDQKG